MGDKITQIFNNYGSGPQIANADSVIVIGSPSRNSGRSSISRCAACKYGDVVMSGPHEGSGMYVKCKRAKRAIIVNNGQTICDSFESKADIKSEK